MPIDRQYRYRFYEKKMANASRPAIMILRKMANASRPEITILRKMANASRSAKGILHVRRNDQCQSTGNRNLT